VTHRTKEVIVRKSVVALSLLAVIAFASVVRSEDPLTVAPHMYKKLFENERVRVMEVTFNPGDSILAHSLPDHHVYAASGDMLKISKPDGTSVDADIKTGDVLFIPAETHRAKNMGKRTIKLIVSELKEPRPAKKDEKKDGK
jgi:quercetin dioxygenase-like cupin family protein